MVSFSVKLKKYSTTLKNDKKLIVEKYIYNFTLIIALVASVLNEGW